MMSNPFASWLPTMLRTRMPSFCSQSLVKVRIRELLSLKLLLANHGDVADADNQGAYELVKRYDPNGHRTIGS